MYLADDTTTYALPNAKIAGRSGSAKVVFHEYEFTDHTDATFMGRGPTKLQVSGVATTAEIEALEFVTTSGQLLTFFYPSEQGGDEDRYYRRVLALPVRSQAITAALHRYDIELHALDGTPYDLNDEPVS